jgi:hypothetical protein
VRRDVGRSAVRPATRRKNRRDRNAPSRRCGRRTPISGRAPLVGPPGHPYIGNGLPRSGACGGGMSGGPAGGGMSGGGIGLMSGGGLSIGSGGRGMSGRDGCSIIQLGAATSSPAPPPTSNGSVKRPAQPPSSARAHCSAGRRRRASGNRTPSARFQSDLRNGRSQPARRVHRRARSTPDRAW